MLVGTVLFVKYSNDYKRQLKDGSNRTQNFSQRLSRRDSKIEDLPVRYSHMTQTEARALRLMTEGTHLLLSAW